jgi:hypothetical protein
MVVVVVPSAAIGSIDVLRVVLVLFGSPGTKLSASDVRLNKLLIRELTVSLCTKVEVTVVE